MQKVLALLLLLASTPALAADRSLSLGAGEAWNTAKINLADNPGHSVRGPGGNLRFMGLRDDGLGLGGEIGYWAFDKQVLGRRQGEFFSAQILARWSGTGWWRPYAQAGAGAVRFGKTGGQPLALAVTAALGLEFGRQPFVGLEGEVHYIQLDGDTRFGLKSDTIYTPTLRVGWRFD
jgi:hypothetical protein